MRTTKKTKSDEYIQVFMMQSYALNELLAILKGICQNLDLSYLNPKIKHFKYFRFTFFGLMVKAKSLLDMIIFKIEFVKSNATGYKDLYKDLLRCKKNMEAAYNLVYKNKMNEGKNKIIQVAEEYAEIFKNIQNIGIGRLNEDAKQ